ncbi:MAG: hypothetical protein BAA04_03915 [Firmicutes bacterium ZCTH02-B6]|nr:MAG: hypothetical protein BAA04_03915 [Firmicutes bacterium ZCTH02-B6]
MDALVTAEDLRKRFPRKRVGQRRWWPWARRENGRGGNGTGASGAAGDEWIVAVDGVSFEVQRGEIFGLLGPNGAGKSTTIRMLSTLLEPSAGTAVICGHDVRWEPMQARARLGVVLAGDRSLYWKLSGRENLEFFATLYHVPAHEVPHRVNWALERMGLADRADELVERYSTGMKQRLSLARALLADPPVLLLDEPTLGLDPQSARNLRELILELKREGRAILLTTHYMEEADFLCDRVAIIDHGTIIAMDSPGALKRRLPHERVYRLELRETNGALRLTDLVPGAAVVEERRDEATGTLHLALTLAEPEQDLAALWTGLAHSGASVVNYSVQEPTLEDVFISLTGRALRD